MIDEYSLDRTGWARFSDDRRMRYMLTRQLDFNTSPLASRAVFVLINPSTADAFKNDRTIDKCIKFARRWEAQRLVVVNLFAFRSTDPKGLDVPGVDRGADEINNTQIMEACTGAKIVIAGWGNNGWRDGRGDVVRSRLASAGIALHHLGLTGEGHPLHPLARGKAFIPLDRKPIRWDA